MLVLLEQWAGSPAHTLPSHVQRHLPALLAADAPAAGAPPTGAAQRVTLFGWSHGGAEALRTAEAAPDLIPHVVGLCPAGWPEEEADERAQRGR
jgi:pimeloyl-ACP methyl ester carboxylesterase